MIRAMSFINPPYRSRSGRFVRRRSTPIFRSGPTKGSNMYPTTRRRSHRRLRVRHVLTNPPKMTPAMRKKISLAVKRSIRARGSRPTIRRSSPVRLRTRTRTRTIVRRVTGSPVRSFRRRRSNRTALIGTSLASVFSQRTLLVAGGAVGAGLLTTYVVNRFASNLPGAATPLGNIAYKLAIPIAGAFLVKRFNRHLAEGMIIGGAVLAINQAINTYAPQIPAAISGTGAYLNSNGMRGLPGAYLPARRGVGAYLHGMPHMNASYDATSAFGAAPSVYDSEPAFPNSAW